MYRYSESVSQCINALFQIIKASHIYRKEISIVDISTLLKNVDIVKENLQNIDIDKILNQLEFGISNRAIGWSRPCSKICFFFLEAFGNINFAT